jgi:hypothetical protein
MARHELVPERSLLDQWLAAVKDAVAAEARHEGVALSAYILPPPVRGRSRMGLCCGVLISPACLQPSDLGCGASFCHGLYRCRRMWLAPVTQHMTTATSWYWVH